MSTMLTFLVYSEHIDRFCLMYIFQTNSAASLKDAWAMKQVSPSVSNAGSVKELVSICHILIRCLHVQKFVLFFLICTFQASSTASLEQESVSPVSKRSSTGSVKVVAMKIHFHKISACGETTDTNIFTWYTIDQLSYFPEGHSGDKSIIQLCQ